MEQAKELLTQAAALTGEMEPLDIRRAIVKEQLAVVSYATDDSAAALALLEEAIALRRRLEESDKADLASALNNLAVIHDERGDLARAVTLYEEASTIWSEAVGPLHPGLVVTRKNLASIYRAQGRYDRAQQLYRTLLEASESRGKVSADQLADLADVSGIRGDYKAAIRLYERAISMESKDPRADPSRLASRYSRLATYHVLRKAPGEAEPLYRKSIEILEKAYGPEDIALATPVNDLATVVLTDGSGRYAEAQGLYERALGIWERKLDAQDPRIVNVLSNLYLAQSYQGRDEDARQTYARIVSVGGSQNSAGKDVAALREALNRLRAHR